MGSTAPASLLSTLVQANCEVLAMLCLVQAAAPGTPFLYAPAPMVMEPHSGRFTSGEVEHALLGGSLTLCLEQLLIDVEVFRRCRRLHRGVGSAGVKGLAQEIQAAGPGGNFLANRSTRDAVNRGEW